MGILCSMLLNAENLQDSNGKNTNSGTTALELNQKYLDRIETIKRYYQLLNEKDIQGSLQSRFQLYAPNAVIEHPIWGRMNRNDLLDVSNKVVSGPLLGVRKYTIQSIFVNPYDPNQFAINLTRFWEIGGEKVETEMVEILTFDPQSNKIVNAKVIYDTVKTREVRKRISGS